MGHKEEQINFSDFFSIGGGFVCIFDLFLFACGYMNQFEAQASGCGCGEYYMLLFVGSLYYWVHEIHGVVSIGLSLQDCLQPSGGEVRIKPACLILYSTYIRSKFECPVRNATGGG